MLPTVKTAPITTAPKRSIGVLGAQTQDPCGREVNQRLNQARALNPVLPAFDRQCPKFGKRASWVACA